MSKILLVCPHCCNSDLELKDEKSDVIVLCKTCNEEVWIMKSNDLANWIKNDLVLVSLMSK